MNVLHTTEKKETSNGLNLFSFIVAYENKWNVPAMELSFSLPFILNTCSVELDATSIDKTTFRYCFW